MDEDTYTIQDDEFPSEIALAHSEMLLVRAFHHGELDSDGQKQVFDLICKKICRLGYNPHAKGDHDQTAFNSGIQKVGHILVSLAAQSLNKEGK